MTTFFGGPGFGGAGTQPPTREAKALQAIDSRTKTFVNKDFVKNIAWLNASVDTLSTYTQKLQQGVDAANQNALEQIQGFIADLIVIFAGGSPTGINLGDLQYIFQAIGAMLGVNPDTVFPLNLVEAVGNLFSQFIVPLPQFTDVIFDAMAAWVEYLGFSDEAVAAVQEFTDAAADLASAFEDIGKNIIPALNKLLKMLGFGSGWLNLQFLRDVIKDLQAKLDEILSGPKELLFNILNLLIVTLFKALTWLVRTINPRNILNMFGLQTLGPQLAPDISDLTPVWQVGSNQNTQWIYTTAEYYNPPGSFTTLGNAYGKRILTQGTEVCEPGETFALSGWLKWQGVPLGQNGFGPCIVWMKGLNEVSQSNIDAPIDRTDTGGWEQVGRNLVAPNDCDGFKIGYRIATSVSAGQVWAGDIGCAKLSVSVDIIGSLVNLFVPWDIFKGIPELQDLSVNGVIQWFRTLLTQYSPIDAEKIFGLIPDWLIGSVSISSLMSRQPNLLRNPGFDTFSSMQGQEDWIWDAAVGHSKFGCARYDCKAKNVELYNLNILPVETGQKWRFTLWAKWSALQGWNFAPIIMGINEYSDERALDEYEMNRVNFDQFGNTGPNSDWVQLSGTYTVPSFVRALKFRSQVTERALGGQVWVDDAVGMRANLLQWNLIDSMQDAWNTLLAVLTGVPTRIEDFINEFTADPLGYLGRQFDLVLERLRNLLPSGLFDAAWLANILNIPQLSDLSVPGILTLVDNVVSSLFRWEGFGFSHIQSAEALQSLREMTLANSVALQEFIHSIQVAGVSDTFGRSLGYGLGPNWAVGSTVGHMNWACNGTAYLAAGYPYGTGEIQAYWQGSEFPNTNTVYQRVGLVVAGAPGYNISGNTGHNDVLFRVGPNTYGRFRVSGDRTWELVYVRDGAYHVIGRGWLPYHYGAGHFVYVDAGDLAAENPWMCRGYVGSDLIWEWEDTSHTILYADNAHRRFGMSGRAEGLLYALNNQKPGPVAQFVATDQMPPPTTG